MPLYNYKCSCGHGFTEFQEMAKSAEPATCPKCGALAPRGLSTPRIVGDYEGYKCPITGKWIEGRTAHEENLKVHGCRVLESGESEAAARYRAEQEIAFDAAIEETVEREFDALPSEAREKLGAELTSGITATVERR